MSRLHYDFSRTRFSLRRSVGSYSKLQFLYSALIRNRRIQAAHLLRNPRRFLNVGCGPNTAAGFINIDYYWKPKVDLCWDVTTPLPLHGRTIDGIYAEHFLEHVSFEASQAVLGEFFRLLRPGGVVRLVVPDAELYLTLYARSRNGERVEFPCGLERNGGVTPLMHVNGVFRNHDHKYAYDFDTLKLVLEEGGFSRVTREEFKRGRMSELLIDTESRRKESLYVEAEKPAG